MTASGQSMRYVLITPVRNEARDIEKTLRSVTRQTVPPTRWVIVDDGSTDDTASIVKEYADRYDWIELVSAGAYGQRSFGSKVRSFNIGHERVRDVPYEAIGNLDGDISFDGDYLEFLLEKLRDDSCLGVVGTVFREDGYQSDRDSFEGQSHVAGGCQIFRRECFAEIGGYQPSPHGGIDWIAVTTARMRGWKTRSFRDKYFFHHRQLGTAQRGAVASAYAYGQKDYSVGGHPGWELVRVAYRMLRKPYVVAGLALGAGFFGSYLRRSGRAVTPEFILYHRSEQMAKLKAVTIRALTLKRIDPFSVAHD
jgi:glycosyltransferase involved in cell wall biosynthesis